MRFHKVILIICLLLAPSLVSAGEYDGGVQAKVILKTVM